MEAWEIPYVVSWVSSFFWKMIWIKLAENFLLSISRWAYMLPVVEMLLWPSQGRFARRASARALDRHGAGINPTTNRPSWDSARI